VTTNSGKQWRRLTNSTSISIDAFSATPTKHERTALARQIGQTDAAIDRLVYELYELTGEEIRIVEAATE